MDSIIKRLAEIEETAVAIVDNAEKQKFEEEKKIQAERGSESAVRDHPCRRK